MLRVCHNDHNTVTGRLNSSWVEHFERYQATPGTFFFRPRFPKSGMWYQPWAVGINVMLSQAGSRTRLITAFLPDHFKSSEEAAACGDSAVMRSPFVLIQATYQQQIIWTTRGHPKKIWRQNVINCQIWQTGCQCSYITRKQAGREVSGTRKRK